MRPPGVRRHCREETFLGNVGQARSRYYKGFASARTETPPFIFGKVGVPRSPMHLQGGRTPAPDNVKKVPPLNLESHTHSVTLSERAGSHSLPTGSHSLPTARQHPRGLRFITHRLRQSITVT